MEQTSGKEEVVENNKASEAINYQLSKSAFVWKVIQRYDGLFVQTSYKGSLMIVLNVGILTMVSNAWEDYSILFASSVGLHKVAIVLTIVIVLVTLFALYKTLTAIYPFGRSADQPSGYNSLIFYDDIAKLSNGVEYGDAILDASEEEILRDICHQAHELAVGLSEKFRRFQIAIKVLYFGQIPLIAILTTTALIAHSWHF